MSEPQKKLKVFLPLLFAITLALGMFLGFKLRDKQGYKHTYFLSSGQPGALEEILNFARLKYVDSIDPKTLKKEAIQGMLSHLDPHSVYIPASQLADVNNDLEGSFQGVGVEFALLRDTINVIGVIPGGPSEAAGLQTGDKIIKVNDSVVAGVHITTDRIKSLLRGPKGSEVTVSVRRGLTEIPFTIKRGVIPLPSVDAAYMITPDVGYIRINRFAANTYGEFMQSMLDLQKDSLKKLIIDLRQNSGGYLDAAVNIADELLSGNKLIVYTQGRHYPRTNYTCNKPGVFEKGPVAILVNGGSASASEILAGAVQDWDRGAIIGRRTFGKGLVQEQYNLTDGGALRLTVARYYIPSGRCIQRPYKNGTEAYYNDLLERYAHGELSHADSIHFSDTTRYYTKIKHRRVYGGGGIMPDIFVPIDTTGLDSVMTSFYGGNVLFDFAYAYYSTHKEEFTAYKTPGEFAKDYRISPAILKAFHAFALKKGIIAVKHLTPADEKHAAIRIKAFIAREIWQLKGYYMVMNTGDRVVKKALEVLGN
ncbi:MAG TPA: S41 family peptidase [Chitinophagaceae bacterium]|nr:S41 family peptidase [Chitinophagaceae bacterium]